MEFKIPQSTQCIIDAWKVAADILDAVDMDEYSDYHNYNEGVIDAIYTIADEMRKIGEEIENEQKAALEHMGDYFKKHYKPA